MSYNDFNNVKEIFKSSKLLVVSTEMKVETETPISLFKKLCRNKKSYLLESAETVDKWGQYSYIGRNPFMEVRTQGNEVYLNTDNQIVQRQGKPLDILKNLINQYKMPVLDTMQHFIGGAVGYIGYDLIRNYETLNNINPDTIEMPDIHVLLMEEIIIYDHLNEKIIIVVNIPISSNIENPDDIALDRLIKIKKEILIRDYEPEDKQSKPHKDLSYTSNEDKKSFVQKVIQAKEYIKSGDIFQVVLSQRLQVETNTDPFDVYETLRALNPSPYMFFIDYGEYHLVGSSPEMLCKVKENIVETCPIAGTRPRGKTHKEDLELAQELLNDEKELAEHLMLVDLARNDIGKISKFGTVKLTNYMEIQNYSHVMHIVSNVTGILNEDYDMFDALVSCMPAGTVSGAPKIRAMEIIDELENNKRGVYAGAVGCIGFNGNMDTCIAIRTIVFKGSTAYIQAGAGIVADSDPESEYLETLRKASALIEAIKITEEGLA